MKGREKKKELQNLSEAGFGFVLVLLHIYIPGNRMFEYLHLHGDFGRDEN